MSELDIMRKFIEIREKYEPIISGYLSYDVKNFNALIFFRNLYDADLVIEYKKERRIILEWSGIGDSLKRDITSHDDLELLLKYGRSISDNVIISNINNGLEIDLTIDSFYHFLNDNFYDNPGTNGVDQYLTYIGGINV